MNTEQNSDKREKALRIGSVSFSLLDKLVVSAISGIMANPNTSPTTQQHFDNIAEDAIRIAKTTIRLLGNES